jgi:hypothetical protein
MSSEAGPIADWTRTSNGQLILVDELNHRVLVEVSDGRIRMVEHSFRYPKSVATLNSTAYVLDSWNHSVKAFRIPDWQFLFDFGGFFCPGSIAVFGELLVIADTCNRRVAFHRPDGGFAFEYALQGFPKRVQVNPDGALVVHYEDGQKERLDY